MLEAPTTRTPALSAARISRWATALSWKKTPSMSPMIVAPAFTAAVMSPRLAGGRYSASRISRAVMRSQLGPRKTTIPCVTTPPPDPVLVHRVDLKPRHDHPDDRDADLGPGEVDDDHPGESGSAEPVGDVVNVGEEVVGVKRR